MVSGVIFYFLKGFNIDTFAEVIKIESYVAHFNIHVHKKVGIYILGIPSTVPHKCLLSFTCFLEIIFREINKLSRYVVLKIHDLFFNGYLKFQNLFETLKN